MSNNIIQTLTSQKISHFAFCFNIKYLLTENAKLKELYMITNSQSSDLTFWSY
jgi:hypothetical protein